MSLLDQIEKEKDGPESSVPQLGPLPAAEEGNNSNRFKDVKTVSIVKKKNNNPWSFYVEVFDKNM